MKILPITIHPKIVLFLPETKKGKTILEHALLVDFHWRFLPARNSKLYLSNLKRFSCKPEFSEESLHCLLPLIGSSRHIQREKIQQICRPTKVTILFTIKLRLKTVWPAIVLTNCQLRVQIWHILLTDQYNFVEPLHPAEPSGLPSLSCHKFTHIQWFQHNNCAQHNSTASIKFYF